MSGKRSHQCIRKAALLIAFVSTLFSCQIYTMEVRPFSYASKGGDFETTTLYDDSLFDNPSTVYNPALATTSLSFAMASFASGDEKAMETLTRYKNAQQLLQAFEFKDFHANDDYHKRSECDTIGLVFAHKGLKDGKELIYVGIRGANYEMEWASNLSIADPSTEYNPDVSNPYHYGFHLAASNWIKCLSEYISSVGIKGDIKVWTSGFSRAGATANIAGGLVDQALDNGEKPFGTAVNLKKEDFYVYCFEPPMGAPTDSDENGKLNARSEKYANIFSHVNFNDPVPLVAMKEVGYTRFGIDRYFPDALSYSNYRIYNLALRDQYAKTPSYLVRGGEYAIDNFKVKTLRGLKLADDTTARTWTQGLFLKELVSELTKFGLGATTFEFMGEAKTKYVALIQPAMRALFSILYRTGNFKGSLIDLGISMINDIMTVLDGSLDVLLNDIAYKDQRRYLFDDLASVVRRGLNKLNIDLTAEEAKKELKNFVKIIVDFIEHIIIDLQYLPLFLTLFNLEGDKSLGFGHYPELCLAATCSLDRNYVVDPFDNVNWAGKYYTVHVMNKLGNVIARRGRETILNVHDGEVDADTPARIGGSSIDFTLPYGDSYTIEADPNDEVEVTLFDYTMRVNDVPLSINRAADGSFSL